MLVSTRLHRAALAALVLVAAACAGKKTNDPVPPATPAGSRPIDDRANVVYGEEMRGGNVQTIEEYLQGRVPGLRVIRDAGGRLTLRIRDNASAESEPLLIIDGTPVQQGGNSDALRAINTREILRVEVLKDASQTAMYGSRGANGVVIIRMRKR